MSSPRKMLDRLKGRQNTSHVTMDKSEDTDDINYDASGESSPDLFIENPKKKSLTPTFVRTSTNVALEPDTSSDILQPTTIGVAPAAPFIKSKFKWGQLFSGKKGGFEALGEGGDLLQSFEKPEKTEKPAKAAPGKQGYNSF